MKLIALALSCAALLCGGVHKSRAATTTHKAHQHRLVYTANWYTATRIVGRYYGSRVSSWLWNCSASEGGHGGFVWFGHYSHPIYGNNTPGGWVQFMGSTFYSNVKWAFDDAKRRGLRAHPKARSYYEPLGQAIVAGAMYFYHGNPGTWTGAYC